MRYAINALEQIEADDPDVRRELIATDANHISPSTPQTMSDVVGRLLQIYFFGKLRLDLKLFEQFSGDLDLIEHLDQELPPAIQLRQHPGYRRLMAHRKIDRFVLTSEDG